MNTLLQSVTLHEKAHPLHNKIVDIRISQGVITHIGEQLKIEASDSVIPLDGTYVSYGWFDPEVSFSQPGYEHKGLLENDLNEAALMGMASVGLMSNTLPHPDSGSALSFYKGFSTHPVSLHPFGCLTLKNKGEELAELYDLFDHGALAFYDYKKPILEANLMKLALQYSQNFGGRLAVFCQDPSLSKGGQVRESASTISLGLKAIPDLSEELAVQQSIALLRYAGGKLHLCGISSRASIALIKQAKKEGLDLSCSVSIGLLYFDEEVLQNFDSRYKTLPGLTDSTHRKALIEAVKSGVIDYVTADHQNVSSEEKDTEFSEASFGNRSLSALFPALCSIFGAVEASDLLKRAYQTYGLGNVEIKEQSQAHLSFYKPLDHTVIEKEPQTHLFHGVSFSYRGIGIFANNQLVLSTAP
ncbi:MAG: dihydroorotase [Bacteroidetes bacterium]|nr:dihydroorotase [Bacteroidota bacterium]